MKHLFLIFIFIITLMFGCSDEEKPDVTSGTVSGLVTFVGTPPSPDIRVEVSIFSKLDEKGRPSGPPDFYSDYFTKITDKVPYKISGVSFGTYKLAAVGYKKPDAQPGTAQTILGIYGYKPPNDMQPDPFSVSKENPEVTGIDIMVDYSAIR